MAAHPFFHHHHHAPANVHVEHLPAGRLFAHPAANPDGVLDPHSLDGSEGHPGILHDFHHSSHSYHSVPPGLYSTELYSGAVCALFAALAVVQLGITCHILMHYTLLLGDACGHAGAQWARGKAQWVAALVPGAAARCCALLLLVADLTAKAGGASPWDVSLLFETSSLFDGLASVLFYACKIATTMGWCACRKGRGTHWQHYMTIAVILTVTLAAALCVTVGLSLGYGQLCLETHDVESCRKRASWYATFHGVQALFSLGTAGLCTAMVIEAMRQRGPGSVSSTDLQRGGEFKVTLQEEAAALALPAGLSTVSFLWWALFNVWGALRAAHMLPADAQAVQAAVGANWMASELLPSLFLSLAIHRQVANLAAEYAYAARPAPLLPASLLSFSSSSVSDPHGV